jgi:hypothetical protein
LGTFVIRRLAVLLLVMVAAHRCAARAPGGSSDALAGACQVQKCVCGPAGWSPFMVGGSVPVRWRENGDAYCPDGYELHPVAPPPTAR